MKQISLAGTWQVRSTNHNHTLKIEVPGTVFDALEKAGTFGPEGMFYRENDQLCRAYAHGTYAFSRTFQVPESVFAPQCRLMLEADGLDTLAIIKVNGTVIARTANMHRHYTFPLGKRLKPGRNTIEIDFADALAFVERRHRQRPLWPHSSTHTELGANHIRKSACSFGWDWGPRIPDVGIWRDIRVCVYEGAQIEQIRTTQKHTRGSVTLGVTPVVSSWDSAQYACRLTLEHPDGTTRIAQTKPNSAARIPVRTPRLWWPNGYGEQPLYRLTCELIRDEEVIQTVSQHLGLRTLAIRRAQKQWGETFHVEVNGVPVFARGANYIPEDTCLTRVTRQRTERLIRDCVGANYNMLRVWGGGVYGSDEFYDLCDRYGILVWQDFMFACKTYPARDEEFCDNVVNEARDNLRRIRHHASLALLCGNNEIEQAFEDWNVDATKENRTEYLKLFQFLLPGVVAEECPEVFYWPSSPSSGGDFEQPNSTRQGDCHYWAVWFGRKPLSDFREHYFPFMSEYGFESFPSIKTIRTFATPEDLNPSSPVIENHQRCPDGNSRIISYLLIYFRLPHDFESLVYLTQVSHAEAIRWGVEHWRRNRGRCMGSLYWQVNDNWPVVSWSSIDYYGRWKAAHYVARRVYDNVLISCEERGHAASLHLSNERRTPVEGNVSWELRGLDGTVVRRGSARVRVAAHNSKRVAALDFSRELADGADRNTYLSYRFREKRGPTYRGTTTFVPYKHLDLQDPRIAARVTEDGDHLRVTVSASSYAKFVALDLARHDTVFSDNFFDIDAGEHVAVSVPKGALSTAAVRKELRVRSLFDARGGV